MTPSELRITREGLARARSRAMRNTLAVIEQEFRGRGLKPEHYSATASVMVAKEISGAALDPSEPGLLGRIAEGESGKFIQNLLEELFAREPDPQGPMLPYDVNCPDGSVVRVRGAATAS